MVLTIQAYVYVASMVCVWAMQLRDVLPFTSGLMVLVGHVLLGFSLFFFVHTWRSDPGFVKAQDFDDHFFENENNNVEWNHCLDCNFLRPPRSHHCELLFSLI